MPQAMNQHDFNIDAMQRFDVMAPRTESVDTFCMDRDSIQLTPEELADILKIR